MEFRKRSQTIALCSHQPSQYNHLPTAIQLQSTQMKKLDPLKLDESTPITMTPIANTQSTAVYVMYVKVTKRKYIKRWYEYTYHC